MTDAESEDANGKVFTYSIFLRKQKSEGPVHHGFIRFTKAINRKQKLPQGGFVMKRLLLAFAVLSLLIVPQFALGADVDEFKVAVEKFVQAFNSFDVATIAQTAHQGLVVYTTSSPFPDVYPTTAAFGDSLKGWFPTLESLNIVLVNPQYKVVENTGVMWGYETSTTTPKDGPTTTEYYRITMTFIKSGGKWLVLTIHMSRLP
jgi:ketosteroid isomerase-like protein